MVEKIKMLTIRALVSDEHLMYSLVLKGGNALQLVYNMTDRASLDIDFSISKDFTEEEIMGLEAKFQGLLTNEFEKHELVAFDIKLKEKPKQRNVKEWKGYQLLFKIIEADKYNPGNITATRQKAIPIYSNHSTQFQVEISSYEYVEPKKRVDLNGSVLFVYTPEMIVFEKLRAICQSMPEYRKIIPSARTKGRARDFYDIWNVCQHYSVSFSDPNNINMLKEIFDAKRVPINFLNLFEKYRDLQSQDWNNVVDTLVVDSKDFNFYFDFVFEKVIQIRNH